MRRLLPFALLLLMLLFPALLFAQRETNAWAFGENALVDFNSGTAVSVGGSAIAQNEGCASIADRRTGALLFYTDGMTVWDRAHQPMPNGTGLNGDISSTQSAMIIPVPLNNFRYYVFTSDAGTNGGPSIGIHYSVVDMATNGGMGSVITKNVFLMRPAVEKLTAARHCNGRDYWVIAHRWESNQFYAWLVSPNGVSQPVISAVGAVHRDLTGLSNGSNTLGYMKASPNGKKIAVAIFESGIVELFDFDNLTGALSNPITLSGVRNAYGLTFSPDNTKIYAVASNYAQGVPASDTLVQFDVTSGVAAIIQSSRVNIYINNTRHFGALQMASDGKVYVGHGYFPMLGIIQSPNTAGLGCNYIHNGLSLGASVCNDGLPNHFDGFFHTPTAADSVPCQRPEAKLGPKDTTICVGTCIDFRDESSGVITEWEWTFGGANPPFSSDQHPENICYNSTGDYQVRLIVGNSVGSDTAYGTVHVAAPPTANAGRDTTICVGDAVQLSAMGGGSYSWSPGATLSCTDCQNPVARPTQTTTYRVVVTDANGCFDFDDVTVSVASFPGVDAGPPATFCIGDSAQLRATGGRRYQWTPATGLSCADCPNPIAKPTQTTLYTVIARSDSGCSAFDTVSVTVLPRAIASAAAADTALCRGDSTQLTASGGTIFRWSPSAGLSCTDCPNPTATPTATTTYTVVVSNATGCPDSATVRVVVNDLPTVSVSTPAAFCLGDSVQLQAVGGELYQWLPASGLSCTDCPNPWASPTATTIYTVIGTNASGCADTTQVVVTVNPIPSAVISGDREICAGDTVQLAAAGGSSYQWSPSSGLSCTDCPNPVAQPDTTTRYMLVVGNGTGCTDTAFTVVTVHPKPTPDAGADMEICLGDSILLQASGGARYQWSPSAGLACDTCATTMARPTSSTNYRLHVWSEFGCGDSDQVFVAVNPPRPVAAHIDVDWRTTPGWLMKIPVILDQALDEHGVDEFTFQLAWDSTLMRLENSTPQRIATMVAGTLADGWNIAAEEAGPGRLTARITAPTGITLRGTGMLLNLHCRMYLGSRSDCPLPFTITLKERACAYVVPSPGLVRIDSVCGLNQRLITLNPTDYALLPNVPNPFNPATEIQFSLGLDGPTQLTILDVAGREVVTLVDQHLQAGEYSLVWDATAYPSGIYYYRLRSGHWSKTNRMMLVK
ncbi:MAG: T9SS type A sorting domain-containing protein [Armatimonadetes bacterium]|nr:T9SS type A sorting domain-containing protein [Armatimonadota bacterium]